MVLQTFHANRTNFARENVFPYVLFLLVTQPKDASRIGHDLNQFEQRQLIEWTPQPTDFLKHDDEKRTCDDVFGAYRDEQANYSTCVFPASRFRVRGFRVHVEQNDRGKGLANS
jgi:hypothetical protein